MSKHDRIALAAALVGCVALFAMPVARAEDAPPANVASPDVYKVIAESGKTRVLLATWQPGQRDNWHSHPATAVYRLTDCSSRVYTPDGKFADNSNKAGSAVLQAPIPSHSFENRGTAECRSVIVEHQ